MSKENPELVKLIRDLKIHAKNHNAKIWKDIAERLEGPSRNYAVVNVSKLERYAKEKEVIIVPGKLLGSGVITKSVSVAAWRVSDTAKDKINNAGGEVLSIRELMEKNPKGSHIRIMG